MDRPEKLVLVRHAESQRNEAKKGSVYFADDETRSHIRGIPDHEIALTERGEEQARQTGRAVREIFGTFDYVYHSGYERTRRTTDLLLEAYTDEEIDGMNIRQNVFIRERDPGYAYDMTEEEAEAAFPWLKEHWQTYRGFFARPPGGESLADVANRVHTFINTLFRDRADESVMVVTHGGTLRVFRYLLERWNYDQATEWNWQPRPENVSVTTYEYSPEMGRLALESYNQVYWSVD